MPSKCVIFRLPAGSRSLWSVWQKTNPWLHWHEHGPNPVSILPSRGDNSTTTGWMRPVFNSSSSLASIICKQLAPRINTPEIVFFEMSKHCWFALAQNLHLLRQHLENYKTGSSHVSVCLARLVGRHGNISWGNTANCKLWHPVVLWCLALLGPVHQQHAWRGCTWHLCLYQVWPGFQQMVLFLLCVCSRDLWPQEAASSVSISTTYDDNFGNGVGVISSCDPCATEVVSGAEDAKIYLRKTHHLRMLSRCSRPFGLQPTRHNAMEIRRRPWSQNVPSGPSILPSRAVGTKNFNSCWTVVSNKQPRETCGNATGR